MTVFLSAAPSAVAYVMWSDQRGMNDKLTRRKSLPKGASLYLRQAQS